MSKVTTDSKFEQPMSAWRKRLYEIIFEADTRAGKTFDIFLLLTIIASVITVMLDSVPSINARYGSQLVSLEWIFTALFTIEYLLRLVAVRNTLAYARSFFGLVDLVALIPTYLSLLIPGTQYLLVVRVLRLLRMFRILKLAEYLHEGTTLRRALWATRRKISVFLLTVVTVVIVIGALMYVVEGAEHGFTSIPLSVYWAVVTLTTVGYGDLSPQTPLGQALAVLVMLLGYGIIAVPTGIVTIELSRAAAPQVSRQVCDNCGAEGHDADARHCKYCGTALH
jgi:voltage-gated potassium channel